MSFSNQQQNDKPIYVLLTGGIGSGKTTIRLKDYANYISVDGGEIYRNIIERKLGNSDMDKIDEIGLHMMKRAVTEKRNIVMEVSGDNSVEEMIGYMIDLGYSTKVIFIDCDPSEAYDRHLKAVNDDPGYLSSYFTNAMHYKWIKSAYEDIIVTQH